MKKWNTTKLKNSWINKIFFSNFKRRLKRNIVSISSLIIGLVSSMLIIGFSNGNHSSILTSSYDQLDYGVASFYKETTQSIEGSKMSLVQMSKPSLEELYDLNNALEPFYVEPNTDALVPIYPLIKSGEDKLEKLSYNQVYSFNDESIDKSILLQGQFPSIDSLYEVVVNEQAYKYLKETFKSEPLDLSLNIYSDYEFHYYTDDELHPVITDYFIYEKEVHIVGVVKDFHFLATPKIYYSYSALRDYLQSYLLNNLSGYLGYETNWFDCLSNSGTNEAISSYSYRLFLKDIDNKESLKEIINSVDKPYKIDSTPITISDTLFDLMDAATMGMELFLAIAVLGTALILGIISFSSYSEDRKVSAILTCLGADKKQIFSIYLRENISLGAIAIIISMLLTPLLSYFINKIIFYFTSFNHMIAIPWLSFLGVPLLFPLMLISLTFLICYFSTYIPLFFSKKISPKEELSEE